MSYCVGVALLQRTERSLPGLDFSDTMRCLQQSVIPPAEEILQVANRIRIRELCREYNERNGFGSSLTGYPKSPNKHNHGNENSNGEVQVEPREGQGRPGSPTRRGFRAISHFANAISTLRRDILDSMDSVDSTGDGRSNHPRSPKGNGLTGSGKNGRTPRTPRTPQSSVTPPPPPSPTTPNQDQDQDQEISL